MLLYYGEFMVFGAIRQKNQEYVFYSCHVYFENQAIWRQFQHKQWTLCIMTSQGLIPARNAGLSSYAGET